MLGVGYEVLAYDGDEGSTMIATRCRGNTIDCHLVFEVISCLWHWWDVAYSLHSNLNIELARQSTRNTTLYLRIVELEYFHFVHFACCIG